MPPPSRPTRPREPVAFAAPVGRRVRLITRGIFAVFALFVIGNLGLGLWQRLPTKALVPMALAPLVGVLIVVPIYYHQRVLGYRLEADELVVRRHGRENRLGLAGLREVTVDREAMAWSLKMLGNDGLGAITGHFRNRRLGRYEAFVTDSDRAVVLRWPDRCVVVSPDRTDEFVAELRQRTRLAS